jgi:diamine N-acetyltransferase
MIRLERISGNNIWESLKLTVGDDQKSFVAAYDVSIIEAYIALTSGGHAFPFGIYDEETPVGFCMISYGTDDSWEDAPAVAQNSYNLWRFMIDRRYQGKGYGKAAMRLILDFIVTQPCGPAELCWLSYGPENTAAKALYAAFGFRETGEWDGDEVIAVKPLGKSPDLNRV